MSEKYANNVCVSKLDDRSWCKTVSSKWTQESKCEDCTYKEKSDCITLKLNDVLISNNKIIKKNLYILNSSHET